LEHFTGRRYRDLLGHASELQVKVQLQTIAHKQLDRLAHGLLEPFVGNGDPVNTGPEKRHRVVAGFVGCRRRMDVRGDVRQLDPGSSHGGAERIEDNAGDRAAGILGPNSQGCEQAERRYTRTDSHMDLSSADPDRR